MTDRGNFRRGDALRRFYYKYRSRKAFNNKRKPQLRSDVPRLRYAKGWIELRPFISLLSIRLYRLGSTHSFQTITNRTIIAGFVHQWQQRTFSIFE